MAKNILEDIKPLSRPGHSTKEIREKNRVPEYRNISEPRPARERPPVDDVEYDEEIRPLRRGPWIIAGVSLIALFFALSSLLAHATVTFLPKVKSVDAGGTYVAEKDTTDENALSFELMTLSDTETATIPGALNKSSDQKATGQVIVYNAYSSAAQPFATDTRLETKDGKIYKISGAVTVPGTTVKNGETIPGSLVVTVYAEKGGESYNIGLTDFTIFGFKGTPKYSKFYARSKTAMTGGASGSMYSADPAAGKAAYDASSAKLSDRLLKNAKAQLPKGFLLFNDAISIVIPDAPTSFQSKDSNVPVTVSGKLYGFLLDEKSLTKKIAEKTVSLKDGESITVPNISELSITIKNKDKIVPDDVKEITFDVSGTAKDVWNVDTDAVATALIGKKKKEFESIMAGFSNIDSAKTNVRPFWRSRFPEKSNDIDIINAGAGGTL